MARKSKNFPLKKIIYVFWEGESEQAYSKFLKDEFDDRSVIKCHRESGTFETAKAFYRGNKRFKSDVEEINEIWFFFDTEIEKADQWDNNMKCLKDIINSRKKGNPIKIRLLMTSCCLEYWLLLHFEQRAPAMVSAEDKERILAEVKNREPSYKKGDYNATSQIAANYPTAIKNGRWTLVRLENEGLPLDKNERDRWLYAGNHTFTTVHEAIESLLNNEDE